LLNALTGEDVAIVTASPGTTRDVLRQQLHLDGVPLNLVDTAGLRSAADAAEAEGIRRARGEMQRADRICYVVDASRADESPGDGLLPRELPNDVPVTVIYNKIDLTGASARAEEEATPPRIYLSARSGAGIDLLRAHLQTRAGHARPEGGVFSARRRHLDALGRARALVDSAARAGRESRGFELFAEDLRLAQAALGEITGEVTSEDLLGAIFASFCIGK
jgi:tRNA modification GTPase